MNADCEQYTSDISAETDDTLVCFERWLTETCVSLKWMQDALNIALRRDGLHMFVWDCCREDDRVHKEHASIVRGACTGEGAWEREISACMDELQQMGTVNGGFCEEWAQSLLDLQARVSDLSSRRGSVPDRMLQTRTNVANDPLISGIDAMKKRLEHLTPETWPGMICLFASMPAAVAQDGDQGRFF